MSKFGIWQNFQYNKNTTKNLIQQSFDLSCRIWDLLNVTRVNHQRFKVIFKSCHIVSDGWVIVRTGATGWLWLCFLMAAISTVLMYCSHLVFMEITLQGVLITNLRNSEFVKEIRHRNRHLPQTPRILPSHSYLLRLFNFPTPQLLKASNYSNLK